MSRGDGSVIAVEVAGEQGATPVLFCHGLADSRLSVHLFTQAARELGLRLVAPDRPGIGRTDPRRLRRLADWVEDAALVLDAAGAGPVALLGVSAGGPFAAACAARLPGRVRSLTLVCPLGAPGWPTRGMAPGQRRALQLARHAPGFGGASTAARSPSPACARPSWSATPKHSAAAAGESPRTCGCSRGRGVSSSVPSRSRHRSTTGMPIPRSRPSTPGCWPRRYRARSFSSTRATVTFPSSAPPGRCLHRSPHRAAPVAVPAGTGNPTWADRTRRAAAVGFPAHTRLDRPSRRDPSVPSRSVITDQRVDTRDPPLCADAD